MGDKDKKYVALIGNLTEGFKAYGPFDSFDDAAEWADMKESWIMTVFPPEKPVNMEER